MHFVASSNRKYGRASKRSRLFEKEEAGNVDKLAVKKAISFPKQHIWHLCYYITQDQDVGLFRILLFGWLLIRSEWRREESELLNAVPRRTVEQTSQRTAIKHMPTQSSIV